MTNLQALAFDKFVYDPVTGDFKYKKNGKEPCENGKGYLFVHFNGNQMGAHRVMWLMHYGEYPRLDIDHINGIKKDNRIQNLREATCQQNNANRRGWRKSISGLKGVSVKNGRWFAQIMVNGKNKHLGYFEDKQIAHLAYKRAAIEHFGEYAKQ